MIDNEWALDFENTIFNIMANSVKKKYKSTYKDLLVTQDEEQEGQPVFPTVLMKQVAFLVVGKTIDGQSINGIRPTYQITISHKGSKKEIEDMTKFIVLFFTNKRFETSNVFYTISNKIRTSTFRVTRVVGANDTLN